jgi:hypothetical protein
MQAVNADLNRLGVVVGDTVDVFGAAHDLLNSPLNLEGLGFSGYR